MSIKHWINGKQVDSADRFTTFNPATGEAIDEVAPAARPRSMPPWRRRPRPFPGGPAHPPRSARALCGGWAN